MLYIIDSFPTGWDIPFLKKLKNALYVSEFNPSILGPNDKVMTITSEGNIKYNGHPYNIFRNCNVEAIKLLDSKVLFTKFMMETFPNNIAKTFYYRHGNMVYDALPTAPAPTFIIKPDYSTGAIGIKIASSLTARDRQQDIVVSEFIHSNYTYTGHYIVVDGKITDKVYFRKDITNEEKYYICKGAIIGYTMATIPDDSVFREIFGMLGYSGFASSNFSVVDGRPIIYEINPRIGGSLVINTPLLDVWLNNFKG